MVQVPQQVPLSRNGRWVVSGGLGALGSLAVHWLASQGVRHITALGRGGRFAPDSDLASLLSSGCAASLTMTQCDAAFSEDMRAVLAPDRRLGEAAEISFWVSVLT